MFSIFLFIEWLIDNKGSGYTGKLIVENNQEDFDIVSLI